MCPSGVFGFIVYRYLNCLIDLILTHSHLKHPRTTICRLHTLERSPLFYHEAGQTDDDDDDDDVKW